MKENIAQYIWQAREELGIVIPAGTDWDLAEWCMCECGNQPMDYEVVFTWLNKKYGRNN